MNELGTLSVRIGKLSAPLLKVYKTKYLRRGAVSDRRRTASRGSGSMCNFGPQRAEFGWQSELVTTKKCRFSDGKTNDSIVFAQHGDEIAVCAPIGIIEGGFGGYTPEIILFAIIW